jgi:hypothetical protein
MLLARTRLKFIRIIYKHPCRRSSVPDKLSHGLFASSTVASLTSRKSPRGSSSPPPRLVCGIELTSDDEHEYRALVSDPSIEADRGQGRSSRHAYDPTRGRSGECVTYRGLLRTSYSPRLFEWSLCVQFFLVLTIFARACVTRQIEDFTNTDL